MTQSTALKSHRPIRAWRSRESPPEPSVPKSLISFCDSVMRRPSPRWLSRSERGPFLANPANTLTDPQVFFDEKSDRWFFTIIEFDLMPTSTVKQLDMAVIRTGDP